MTTPVSNTAASTASAAAATSAGLQSLTSNFNTFLTLLTTQLKNQDPLAPLDSNQFTQQLTQMSGVEAQLQGNTLLQKLVANTGGSVAGAVGLIGKQARATSDTAALSNGQASWTYNLATPASDLKIQVLDSSGTVVDVQAPTDLTAGDHTFNWDGKALDGTQFKNGTYTLKVVASDDKGAAVKTTTSVQGLVTGIEQANGDTLLTINGGQVSLSNITSVNTPAQTASGTTTTNTSGG
jgi:flagellar basal-body rod modification protein FlgD